MFGVGRGVKSRNIRPCTKQAFEDVIHSPHVASVCAELMDLEEAYLRGDLTRDEFETKKKELKNQLSIFTFHATFKNGRRVNAEAEPSGLFMLDIDHIEGDVEAMAKLILQRLEAAQLMPRLALLHKTPSTHGLRIVLAADSANVVIAEMQQAVQKTLAIDVDTCVKDLARCSYAVPADYIFYRNDELLFGDVKFTTEDTEGHRGENLSSGERSPYGVKENKNPLCSSVSSVVQKEASTEAATELPFTPDSTREFKGIPYTDIISEWFTLNGGEPVQGERNATLHKLACALKHITDSDEALLLSVMPRYGLSGEEMKQVIKNAAKSDSKWMPKQLKEAIRKAEEKQLEEELQGNTDAMPALPRKLPPLIELLLTATPAIYREAVSHSVFAPLGVHLHKVYFPYIDNKRHEATFMCVLMAGTGAGKDCISEPINYLMADIRERDAVNLRREREWKQEMMTKGANKDKKKRPEGLVIQEIDADMTNPALVMRLAEADEHFLYAKLNEIDQFDALRGSSSSGQQFQIMCLAFDPNNRYGQTRVGAQSVTEKVCIRFNWNAATTIQKGKRYFSRVLTDGPLSRINFCTIASREIGADMPVYGEYPADFAEQLKPYIANLCNASGEVRCEEALKFARKLKEECAEHSRLSQSRVYENFSFRALVIAYLKAMVLYVAHGYRWSKEIERFVRWSLRYDLWCKMAFFGEAVAKAMDDGSADTAARGPRNLLLMLPDTFTMTEASALRVRMGLSADALHMVSNWKTRKYIAEAEVDGVKCYKKLKYKNMK